MKALQKMGTTPATDAGAVLGDVRCPVLVVQGTIILTVAGAAFRARHGGRA